MPRYLPGLCGHWLCLSSDGRRVFMGRQLPLPVDMAAERLPVRRPYTRAPEDMEGLWIANVVCEGASAQGCAVLSKNRELRHESVG